MASLPEELEEGFWQELQAYSEQLGLWLGRWEGEYQQRQDIWLRFYDAAGHLVLLPEEAERERAEAERERAEAERNRAEAAEVELARLRARLAELEGEGEQKVRP